MINFNEFNKVQSVSQQLTRLTGYCTRVKCRRAYLTPAKFGRTCVCTLSFSILLLAFGFLIGTITNYTGQSYVKKAEQSKSDIKAISFANNLKEKRVIHLANLSRSILSSFHSGYRQFSLYPAAPTILFKAFSALSSGPLLNLFTCKKGFR